MTPQVTADWLQRSFAVHTTGPLLLMQALAPLLRVKKHERPPSAVVNISARVGSIQDNNLGGWCDLLCHCTWRCRALQHVGVGLTSLTAGLRLNFFQVLVPHHESCAKSSYTHRCSGDGPTPLLGHGVASRHSGHKLVGVSRTG